MTYLPNDTPRIADISTETLISLGGISYRVTQRLGTQLVLTPRSSIGLIRVLTEAELMDDVVAGRASIGAREEGSISLQRVEELLGGSCQTLSERQIRDIRIKTPYVKAALDAKPRTRGEWQAVVDEVFLTQGHTQKPVTRSVQKWTKQFRAGQQAPIALATRCDRRGRARDWPALLIYMARQLIEERYLCREGSQFTAVYDELETQIKLYNQGVTPEQALPLIHRTTLVRFFHRTYHPYDVYAAKRGKEAADRHWKTYKKAQRLKRILERSLIDSTLVDLIVVDSQGRILGRPWITVCMDAYSAVITGAVISFVPPSIETFSQCLRMAVAPKGFLKEKYGWGSAGFHGLMDEVMCDNALEYHSDFAQNLSMKLGIRITYHPAGQPWWKGRIERWFGEYARKCVHILPGTTFSDVHERGDYDSEGCAEITLEKLRELTWMWIEKYHETPHGELQMFTPRQVWEKSSAEYPPRPLRDIDDLNVFLSPADERGISSNGISLHSLFYDSDALKFHRGAPDRLVKVMVYYDPSDLGSVFVQLPGVSRFTEIPCVNADYARGLALYQHREITKLRTEFEKKQRQALSYLEATARYYKGIDEARGTRKTKKYDVRGLNLPSELLSLPAVRQRKPDVKANLPDILREPLPTPQPGGKLVPHEVTTALRPTRHGSKLAGHSHGRDNQTIVTEEPAVVAVDTSCVSGVKWAEELSFEAFERQQLCKGE